MPTFDKDKLRLYVQIFILLAVIWICYIPALDSFFVADDIWQVNFAHKVFDGRTELILRNFTSNYLQLPSFGFYRPLLGFTFLFDYLLYGVNAVGYHVTSLVLYSGIVLLLFLLMRTMTRTWPDFNSSWTSFFTALLFAVTPLHCEAVTWISGRADICSAPFYLAALYFVVRSHQEKKKKFYWFSLLSFWGALFSKEIAIGLPFVIFAYYFLWPEEEKFAEIYEMVRKEKAPDEEESEEEKPGKKASAGQVAHAARALKQGKKKRKKKGKGKGAERASTESGANDSEVEDTTSGEGGTGTADGAASKRPGKGFAHLFKNFGYALKMSAPFLASGAVYMLIRYNALGDFIGGYGGMMGGALGRHLLLRWFDPINIERIILPFPQSVTNDVFIPQWIIMICLVTCCCIILMRFLAKSKPLRWFLFLWIWMITAIIPLAKLWGVGQELETSRLLFFFTFGYSALWPVLLFHPPKERLPSVANRGLGWVSGFVFIAIACTFAWATYNTNTLWLTAGHELKKIWLDTVELTKKLGPDEKVMILGIPKDYKGAHVNFNGSTFHHMLRPPFIPESVSEKVITFEPYIVGPYEVINSDRLKELLNTKGIKGPYVWKSKELAFELMKLGGKRGFPDAVDLPFNPTSQSPLGNVAWRYDGKGTAELKNNGIVIRKTQEGAALKFEGLDINPLEFDFIEFDIGAKLKPGDRRALVPMAIGWNSVLVDTNRSDWAVLALHVEKLKEPTLLRLHLSHYWQWYSAGTIKSFVVRLFDADEIVVKNARLVKKTSLIPSLGIADLKPLNSGEYVVNDNEQLTLVFDGTNIPNAKSVEIEVTKPNFFFDNYLMGTDETEVNRILKVPFTRGGTPVKMSLFKEPAYYEMRLRCLDDQGKPVGYWSEQVTILKMGGGLDTYVF